MNGHSKSKRLERDLREGLINISYVTDLGRGHILSPAFFSGTIKHQTEKSGPQGAPKTSETLQIEKHNPRHVQKFCSRLKKLFLHK